MRRHIPFPRPFPRFEPSPSCTHEEAPSAECRLPERYSEGTCPWKTILNASDLPCNIPQRKPSVDHCEGPRKGMGPFQRSCKGYFLSPDLTKEQVPSQLYTPKEDLVFNADLRKGHVKDR